MAGLLLINSVTKPVGAQLTSCESAELRYTCDVTLAEAYIAWRCTKLHGTPMNGCSNASKCKSCNTQNKPGHAVT